MAITVKRVTAYEISDSNGNPTIELEMLLSNGFKVTSSASSDNVINTYGLRELRDNDVQHYQGLGVKKAVSMVNKSLAPKMVNMNPADQFAIDNWINRIDPSRDKVQIGVNTAIAISQLFAKAGAYTTGMPLFKYINDIYLKMTKKPISLEKVPTPVFGMLGGGRNVDFREFHLIPSSSLTFAQAYEMCVDIYHTIQTVLDQLGVSYYHSLYGEYIPARNNNTEMIEVIFDVLQRKNLRLGKHVFFGLSPIASNFYIRGKYQIKDRPTPVSPQEYYEFLSEIINKYSVLVVEDPFATQDVDGWRKIFVNYGEQIYIVAHKMIGDNIDFLSDISTNKMFTSIVVKPIYFGTITDTLKTVAQLKKKEMSFMVSGDKNETSDDFIADFAMGVQADFIKFGAPAQGERVAKYNRLLKIEQQALMMKAAAPKAVRATPLPKKLLEQIKK